MAWGSLSGGMAMDVLLRLRGAADYIAQMEAASRTNLRFARDTRAAAMATQQLTRRTWLQNQALFTLRRYAFYGTLAITGLAVEIIRLGFSYQNALQTSRVALAPVITSTSALNKELQQLYGIAALSPFLFKDTVVAFRQMYAAFHPLGISVEFTNKTIQALIDALSYAGRTTPSALNRVSVALQHMAFLGRLNGQTVLQLARDGLPIYAALHKQLGLTADQMHRIGDLGIDSQTALKALIRYINTTPGYMGAALRQANQTLSGSWAQFRDILSQAAGGTVAGSFTGLHRILFGINKELAPLIQSRKPIGMLDLVNAIDHQLTPSTHIIINLFQFFKGVLQGLVFQFKALAAVLWLFLYPFNLILGATRANTIAFRLLGYITSFLITIWIIGRIVALKQAFALDAMIVRTFVLAAATKILAIANLDLDTILLTVMYKYEAMSAIILKRLIPAFTTWIAEMWAAIPPLTAINILTGVGIFLAVAAVIALLAIYWRTWTHWLVIAAEWIWRNWKYLALLIFFIPGIGQMVAIVGTLVKYWSDIAHWISTATDALGRFLGFFGKVGRGIWSNTLGRIPGLQSGGVTSGGPVVVGERGPELAIPPRGTRIIPHSQAAAFAGGNMPEIRVHVYPQAINFDGRKIGEVISTIKTDKAARA
jgi:Tape measure protein